MAVGTFDRDLFEQVRRMPQGPRRRFLMGKLLDDNDPLVKLLVGQLLGKSDPRPGMRKFMGRLPGAELLDMEDALQAGRMGMLKALEGLDLQKGKLSYYALHKIRYELQCLLAKTSVVRVERGKEGSVGVFDAQAYVSEEDEEARLTFDNLVHEHREGSGDAEISHDEVVIRIVDAERHRPAPREPALSSFLRERLSFGRGFRVARSTLLGAYERHVRRQRGNLALDALRKALRERDVRPVRVRVPFADWPVPGFAGVVLQNVAAPDE